MTIGSYTISNPVVLAPMAGVTDRPFRELCLEMGAGMAVSEMVGSSPGLRDSKLSSLRMRMPEGYEPRSVQILGTDPLQMAEAARHCQSQGAQIVDINMGCPAKKVCNKAAGSALMRDPHLVRAILQAVVGSVTVPVTLKIRTGWDCAHKNGTDIAQIAQECGVSALTVHGRTRACKFRGSAEYDTIAKICAMVEIPVIANGDITSPAKAKYVLDYTGADAIMIGRAAQGRPWIFRETAHYLECGQRLPPPSLAEVQATLMRHLERLYHFYGETLGARIARKHVGWYLQTSPSGSSVCKQFNRLESAGEQKLCILKYFQTLCHYKDIAA